MHCSIPSAIGVGIGDAGQLGDAELEAEPRDELEWREAEERLGERELQNDRCWARQQGWMHTPVYHGIPWYTRYTMVYRGIPGIPRYTR